MDLYYQPNSWNLVPLGEVEYSSGSYEFDTVAVWHDPTTMQLYWARDSGCSCPTPFENIHSRGDLNTGTAWELKAYLDQQITEGFPEDDDFYTFGASREYVTAESIALFQKVRGLPRVTITTEENAHV